VVAAYLVLQALYHWGLKAIAVADVFCIASGFVLRAALGAAAISVQISGWLLLCTGALALMVGFGKRRAEYVAMGTDRTRTRAALGQYSERALDALVSTSATGASLCYGVYALESPTAQAHPGLLLTTPFVFYGVCRYLLMVFRGDDTGEPENLFWRDRHLIVTVIGFLVTAGVAMMNLPLPLLERAP
jgi:4-hydroxybenzoate polyprenyltransferase